MSFDNSSILALISKKIQHALQISQPFSGLFKIPFGRFYGLNPSFILLRKIVLDVTSSFSLVASIFH